MSVSRDKVRGIRSAVRFLCDLFMAGLDDATTSSIESEDSVTYAVFDSDSLPSVLDLF